MARETKELTIGGNAYTIGHHGPDNGDEIVAYLTKTAGPIAVACMGMMDNDAEDPKVAGHLAGGLAGLSGKEHARFMRLLLSVCTVNGAPLDGKAYDAHFIGLHGERYRLAVEVIRHNGFFDVVGALMDALKTPESPAPQT